MVAAKIPVRAGREPVVDVGQKYSKPASTVSYLNQIGPDTRTASSGLHRRAVPALDGIGAKAA